MSQQSASDQVRPWWRYPIVWMVIGGPAIVVVASFVTLGLALKHGDPVLDTSGDHAKARNEAPAMQGRNHAAERPNQTSSR